MNRRRLLAVIAAATAALMRGNTMAAGDCFLTRGANVAGCDLSGNTYDGDDLTRANISRTQLVGASFVGANLTRANLSGANVTDADFSGATITGANMKNQVRCNTTLPDGNVDNSGC